MRAVEAESGAPDPSGADGFISHTGSPFSDDPGARASKARMLNCFQRAIVRHGTRAARERPTAPASHVWRAPQLRAPMVTTTSALLEALPALTEEQLASERRLAALPVRMEAMPEDMQNAVAGLLELASDAPMAAAAPGVVMPLLRCE